MIVLSNMRLQEFGTLDNYKFTFDHLIGQTLMFCGDPYSYMGNRDFKVGGYYKVTGTLPDDVRKGLYCRMILRDVETGEKKKRVICQQLLSILVGLLLATMRK